MLLPQQERREKGLFSWLHTVLCSFLTYKCALPLHLVFWFTLQRSTRVGGGLEQSVNYVNEVVRGGMLVFRSKVTVGIDSVDDSTNANNVKQLRDYTIVQSQCRLKIVMSGSHRH